MSTSKEQQYNIDQLKKNADTGNTYKPSDYGAKDLSAYGIDYSQAQRDAIANIFKDSATAAYGTAQNQYSNTMAQQQASLQDTMRRSQAQAVATGASKGMQAANELSAMLGLQQTAAQEASAVQGSYAEALANAQQQAYDVQNAANQIGAAMYTADTTAGAEKYSADVASDAQKYAANIDAQINDPYRILSEINSALGSGDTTTANLLIRSFLSGSGVSENLTKDTVNEYKDMYKKAQEAITNANNATTANSIRSGLDTDNKFEGSALNAIAIHSTAIPSATVNLIDPNNDAPIGAAYRDSNGRVLYVKTKKGWVLPRTA